MKKFNKFKSGMTLAIAMSLFANTTVFAYGNLNPMRSTSTVVVSAVNQQKIQDMEHIISHF